MQQHQPLEVHIRITNNRDLFTVGDTVEGVAELTVPETVPLDAISLSFHCLGEVKWVEVHGTAHYMEGKEYYDQHHYLDDELPYNESDVTIQPHKDHKVVYIPFKYQIPDDPTLPSTMVSNQGFIQYFVRASIRFGNEIGEGAEVKRFVKEITVHSPFSHNLMVTVGASTEKSVLLHPGRVSMHASIGRKGFAPGEVVSVHVHVANTTSAAVLPKVALSQVQIYQCGECHKTIESTLNDQWVAGAEVGGGCDAEQVLDLPIPPDESLSIKSSLITVKYFVLVTVEIPQAFDLHLSLPVVVTSKKVLEKLHRQKEDMAAA